MERQQRRNLLNCDKIEHFSWDLGMTFSRAILKMKRHFLCGGITGLFTLGHFVLSILVQGIFGRGTLFLRILRIDFWTYFGVCFGLFVFCEIKTSKSKYSDSTHFLLVCPFCQEMHLLLFHCTTCKLDLQSLLCNCLCPLEIEISISRKTV